MSYRFLIAIMIFGFQAATAFATGPLDCPGSLKPRLPTLTLNPDVIIREGEKYSFGSILKRGEKFPNLKNGTHVFILDQDQNLVFAERYPDFDEMNPVVTHRSLYRKLEETLGQTPKLIGLGEIQVDHGVISFVSNKAGTAFLPDEYLPELVEVLKERGLPVIPETKAIPYKMVKSGHQAEQAVAAYRIQVDRDPVFRELQEKITVFRAEAFKRFPSKEIPGTVDWRSFFESSSGPENRFTFQTMGEPERMFFVAFSWLENMNDRYRTIPELASMMSKEDLVKIITDFQRFEGVFYNP
jgi:hypothetical protein